MINETKLSDCLTPFFVEVGVNRAQIVKQHNTQRTNTVQCDDNNGFFHPHIRVDVRLLCTLCSHIIAIIIIIIATITHRS